MTTSIDGPKIPRVESAKTAHSLPFSEIATNMGLISRRLEHGENVAACQIALHRVPFLVSVRVHGTSPERGIGVYRKTGIALYLQL
ncbi:MAG: hypothetical protein P1U69_05005 [Parvibaculaceae bacterium]|nr:hypothetical protein [Parvibaculaceae bacterium]HBM88916.1 hypothetical protein [Rhodobiaceae bacterium]